MHSSVAQRLVRVVILGITLLPLPAFAGFGFSDVVERAKALAAKPYEEPEAIPKFLREMSFAEYQNIRFPPERSLWRASKANFQIMLVPPGLYYDHPVKLHVIDAQGVHPIPFRKSDFTYADPEVEKRIPADLGYAGFKLTFPLAKPGDANQFLVFGGASYFRAIGKDNNFGLSGRGIAVDTGLSTGEQFPSFLEFWMERPAPDAKAVSIYGLLDGKSITGAYHFAVLPGKTTLLKVKAILFPRDNIKLLGLAPLTSMFYYGENTARPMGEWRTQVHDSDGLSIHDGGSGEWLWRPLLNPKSLQMDYMATESVKGFGLLQRDVEFSDYQDLAAHYERRPSAWVEPQGDWGNGKVVLVQLPTSNETNDNIVAFWTPGNAVGKDKPLELAYDLSFGGPEIAQNPMGMAVNTMVGDGNRIGGGSVAGSYRFIVDFSGGLLDKRTAKSAVVGKVTGLDGTEVIEQFVEYNETLKSWRLSILAKPKGDKPLSLRAFLSEEQEALTETWTYRLPRNNDVLPVEE